MNIQFHAPFSINEYTKNLVVEKVQKLEKLQLRFSEADVFFKLKEGNDNIKDKELELKIHVPSKILFVTSHAETFEKAIAFASQKMRKQILKYKASLAPSHSS